MLCAEIWRLWALFSKPLTFKIAGSSKSQHFRSSKSLHNRWLFESAALSKLKSIFVCQFRSSKSILYKRYEILGQIGPPDHWKQLFRSRLASKSTNVVVLWRTLFSLCQMVKMHAPELSMATKWGRMWHNEVDVGQNKLNSAEFWSQLCSKIDQFVVILWTLMGQTSPQWPMYRESSPLSRIINVFPINRHHSRIQSMVIRPKCVLNIMNRLHSRL